MREVSRENREGIVLMERFIVPILKKFKKCGTALVQVL